VSARAAAISGLAVGVLVLATAWLFAAAIAGLGVFWARAAADSIRGSRHPRLILGAIAAVLVVGVVLTVLGVELPRE